MKKIIITGQSNAKQTGNALVNILQARHIGVINCAVGGSEVTEWQKGSANYMNALFAANECLEAGDRIVGMFHMQGEAESGNIIKAAKWKVLTLKFFRQFRVQIGLPDLPVVFAQIGPKPTDLLRPCWGMVQNKQTALNYEWPEFRMIVTSDIKPYSPAEGPHWSSLGYMTIAQRVDAVIFGGTND